MTENLGLKFLSVLIAISLWVVVFGTKTIEITKEIPFEVITGEDQTVEEMLPEKVTFRMSGPKAFLTSITNRVEEPIRVNLKEIKPGLFNYRVYSDAIKLPLGVKVQSIHPNVIPIRIEELKRKMVNIDLDLAGKEKLGERFARAEVLPPQVRIKGPKNRIASLNAVKTLPIDIGNLQHTTIIPLTFDLRAFGVDVDSVLPELNVEVQGRGQAFRVKHVPLKVSSNSKVKCDETEVTVIGWVKVQLPEHVHLLRVIPPFARVEVKNP